MKSRFLLLAFIGILAFSCGSESDKEAGAIKIGIAKVVQHEALDQVEKGL